MLTWVMWCGFHRSCRVVERRISLCLTTWVFLQGEKHDKKFGLGYDKIHVFPNNCMLFWNENSKKDNCCVVGLLDGWKLIMAQLMQVLNSCKDFEVLSFEA